MAVEVTDPDSRPIPRKELAQFLPSLRLVKAFEAMQKATTELLPDQVATINASIEEVQLTQEALSARAAASDAFLQVLLDSLLPLLVAPFSEVTELRERVAVLERRIQDLQSGPTP